MYNIRRVFGFDKIGFHWISITDCSYIYIYYEMILCEDFLVDLPRESLYQGNAIVQNRSYDSIASIRIKKFEPCSIWFTFKLQCALLKPNGTSCAPSARIIICSSSSGVGFRATVYRGIYYYHTVTIVHVFSPQHCC